MYILVLPPTCSEASSKQTERCNCSISSFAVIQPANPAPTTHTSYVQGDDGDRDGDGDGDGRDGGIGDTDSLGDLFTGTEIGGKIDNMTMVMVMVMVMVMMMGHGVMVIDGSFAVLPIMCVRYSAV